MTRHSTTSVAERIHAAGADWIVPEWPAPPHVQAFVTTRNGGASSGAYATMNLGRRTDDNPAALAENSRRLFGYLPSTPVWMDQVHGSTVVTLEASAPAAAPIADAAITRHPGVVCAVLIADCLPILFANRAGSAVGVAHAGWRGLARGVVESTVAAFAGLNIDAGELVAWIGPGIGSAAFEVGADVVDAFCGGDSGAAACFAPLGGDKWNGDLASLAKRRLRAAGIAAIAGGGFCTYTDASRFFSYRRQHASGRMAALAWLDADQV
jgi:polyphenol oxidase